MGSFCSRFVAVSHPVPKNTRQIPLSNQDSNKKVNPISLESLSLEEANNSSSITEACITKTDMMEHESKKVTCKIDDEEQCCPICLEEYTTDNPKLTTECKHEYHYPCILEWIDRSFACPICSKVITLDT